MVRRTTSSAASFKIRATIYSPGIVLMIVLLIIAAMILLYRYEHRTTNPLPTGPVAAMPSAKKYTYPGNIFHFSYPANWTASNGYQGDPSKPMAEYPLPIESNKHTLGWLSAIPHLLSADDNSQGVGMVTMNVYRAIPVDLGISADTYKEHVGGCSLYSSKDVTINGNRAKFLEFTSGGVAPDKASTVNDNYIISHGAVSVDVGFTVKFAEPGLGQKESVAAGARPLDFSDRLPVINSIVRTISF